MRDDDVAEDLRAKRTHALRRGRPITDAELLEGEGEPAEGEEAADEEEDEGEEAAADATMREVKWAPLPGLQVLKKPEKLDDALVGQKVYLRWETPWGWTLGVITERLTSATPRLFKKFNFRVKWSDGSKGPANLPLDNYSHGPTAPYNSWCLLQKEE